jgi:integrase
MKRACELAKHRRIRVYEARHAAATTWLKAGLPLGDTSRRLGHSVETLVSHYIGALDGDETSGNKLIDIVLSATREQIVEAGRWPT